MSGERVAELEESDTTLRQLMLHIEKQLGCLNPSAHSHPELIDCAKARVAELEEALKPFAKIKPSSFYPEDGSESEGYGVVLTYHQAGEGADFTGKDLANAKAALEGKR
jgi:hypothetical protein